MGNETNMGIAEQFKDISTVTVKVTIPLRVWEEWNEDCEQNFNSARYLKMKYDHDFRKKFGALVEYMADDIINLKERLALLEEMSYKNHSGSHSYTSRPLTFSERAQLKKETGDRNE